MEKIREYSSLGDVLASQNFLRSTDSRDIFTNISTGVHALDHNGGIKPGQLFVIAGRPITYKTTLAMNIVEHVAVTDRLPTLVFSLDQTAPVLANRFVGWRSGVDQSVIVNRTFDDSQRSHVISALHELGDAPIFVDDRSVLTVNELREQIQNISEKNPSLALVVIDGIEHVTLETYYADASVQAAEVTKKIKNIASELNLPIIVTYKLPREVEKPDGSEPIPSDARPVISAADVLLILHRHDLYGDMETPHLIKISKNRNGFYGHMNFSCKTKNSRIEVMS